MKILNKLEEKLYWHGYFFFCILFLLITTTQVDHQVNIMTGGMPMGGVFICYALSMTLLNQAIAVSVTIMYWIHSLARSKFKAFLIYVTTVWVWIGGALDFLFFMMKGYIPEGNQVWHWMPFYWFLKIEWTTLHQAIYTIVFLVVLIIAWSRS